MIKHASFATIIGLALAASAPANAAVFYQFTASSSFDFSGEQITGGGFSVIVPSYITSDTSIPLANLLSCSVATTAQPTGGQCRNQDFLFNISPGYDTVSFGINTNLNPATGVFYYFLDGAFSTPGLHNSQIFGANQFGTLLVRNLDAGGVPEPATWALLAAGFGAIGFAMRRKPEQKARVRFAF